MEYTMLNKGQFSYLPQNIALKKQITYLEETYLGKAEGIIKERAEEVELGDSTGGKKVENWGTEASTTHFVKCFIIPIYEGAETFTKLW